MSLILHPAALRPAINDAQPYGFFKTLMLGNDEEILYKVAQVLGNLSDRSGVWCIRVCIILIKSIL